MCRENGDYVLKLIQSVYKPIYIDGLKKLMPFFNRGRNCTNILNKVLLNEGDHTLSIAGLPRPVSVQARAHPAKNVSMSVTML